MVSANNVGYMLDNGYTIHAYCLHRNCRHHGTVDLRLLATKLGREASTMHWDLVPRLKCSKCGGREISLTFSPPTTMNGDYPSWSKT